VSEAETALSIFVVVEGHGDERAAPHLLRRITHEHLGKYDFSFKPYNTKSRGNITTPNGIESVLGILRKKTECKGVLVLLDAEAEDRDCPVSLACELAKRVQKQGLPFPVTVVVAVCEYESWFLANLERIAPHYLADPNIRYNGDVEEECSAKGWLSRHRPSSLAYKETVDQERLTFEIDLKHTAEVSRSFKRLIEAVEELLDCIDRKATVVTPIEKCP
jgi:hypothetical protein